MRRKDIPPEIMALREKTLQKRAETIVNSIDTMNNTSPITHVIRKPLPTIQRSRPNISTAHLGHSAQLSLIQPPNLIPGYYVSVRLLGGVGNRLFQILAALAYSERFQKTCVISRGHISNGGKPHENNLDNLISRIFPHIQFIENISHPTVISERSEFKYSPLTNCLTNVLLVGYFQCDQYFPSSNHIPILKTDTYRNTYFLHIRAGDYIGNSTFYQDLTIYYRNCINTLGPNIRYIVFSNDNEYASKYMKQFDIEYTLSDKTDQLDILIEMANCEGAICANSSFSWMGAFFQDKAVGKRFMPSMWLNGKECSGIYPKWATVIDIKSSSIHKQLNCITFGDGDEGCRMAGKRVAIQAKSLGLFNKVIHYTDEHLKSYTDFWNIHSTFIENNKRGHGYWLWKPFLIKETMKNMSDGDILLYLDAGCEIDINRKDLLIANINIVKRDYILGSYNAIENKYTKMDLISRLDMVDDPTLNTEQHQATAVLFLVCKKTRILVEEWYELACNYNLIDDSPSIEPNLKTFVEHRHDQSIFSLLTKKYSIYSSACIDKTIELARNKTGTSIFTT